MPVIQVNLGDVQAFDNLPIGSYLGEINKITYREAKEAGKFPQMMVGYTVIDGDQINRSSNEFLSFSPKALFRLKRWFMKFGLGDIPELVFDEDSDELNDPDLYGSQVIFTVSQDGERFRTELVSVEELGAGVPVEKEVEAPAPRRAAAAAAAKVEDDDELQEVEEEEEPAPVAPRRPAPTPAKGTPVRRTLR